MMRFARRGLVAPLAYRDFRLLVAAYSVSAAGSWAYNVALAVYVYDRTHSAAWVGAVTLGRFLPSVLFGAYGGVLAERFERTRLMVSLDFACAVLMGGLTVLAAYHGPALAAIAISGASGIVTMAYQPAVAALTPELVPEDELAAANTLNNTVANIAIVAGPALGAVLLTAGDPALAFAANAISFLWSAGVVSRISARSTPIDVTAGGSAGPLRQMLVGARAIISSSSATVLAAYSVVASFVYGVDTVIFVVLSEKRLGTGADGYSYLLAGLGVGGLLAAGLVRRISEWPKLGTAIVAAMGVYCLPTLVLVAVRKPVIAFVVEIVRGGGTLVVDVLAMTALQRSLPKDKLARVFGAFFTFVLLAIVSGAVLAPVVLSSTNLLTTLWLAGGGVPALCLLGWPWLRRMDRANLARLAEITPRVALLQRAAIFAKSSRPVLENLARASTMVDVPGGAAVVKEGEPADALYIVESGALMVTSEGAGPGASALSSLGPGDYFGEVGLLHRIARTATVTTISPSRLLRVDGQTFLLALSSNVASPSLLEGAQARLGRTPAYLPSTGELVGLEGPGPTTPLTT
jgi:CRP-like cAMP-binding protein/MFS family permease